MIRGEAHEPAARSKAGPTANPLEVAGPTGTTPRQPLPFAGQTGQESPLLSL